MQSCWVKVLIAEAISLPLQSTRQLQERAKPNGEVLHHLFLTFPSNLAVAPSCTRIFRGGRVNAGASAGTGGLSVRDVLETRVDVTSFTSPMMWTVKEKKVVIQKLWWLITYITVTAKNHIRSRLSCMYTTFIYIVKVFKPKVTSAIFWVQNWDPGRLPGVPTVAVRVTAMSWTQFELSSPRPEP